MILSVSFKHGGYYHYRLHKTKIDRYLGNGFSGLREYLYAVRKNCPAEYFESGPRSSVLKISLGITPDKISHEVETLARMGLESGYYDNAHMNVQMFMLAYDNKTLGIEVPLWLKASEFEDFQELFNSALPLTGHIDLIRFENGKVWIWDYKPNAHREKFAHTQVYFYALMLSKRTGLPLEQFMCGYFDDKSTYVFDPSKAMLEKKSIENKITV